MPTPPLIRLAERGSLQRFRACLEDEPHPPEVLAEALRYALAFAQPDKAELLLAKGVDPLSENSEGSQFITHAAVGGDVVLVRRLLDLGCDPNHVSTTGRTPLMDAAYSKSAAAVALLLEQGADPNRFDRQGWTPLLDALRSRSAAAAQSLLQAGAALDVATPGEGHTPLMLATRNGDAVTARLLLDLTAEVDAGDRFGRTALMHAAMQGGLEMVQLLLEAGANPQLRDQQGRSALDWAAPLQPEISRELLQVSRLTPEQRDRQLLEAARKGHTETLTRLLQQGAVPQPAQEGGESALLAAATARDPGALRRLIAHPGSALDYRSFDAAITPLMMTVRLGHQAAMQALLVAGADPRVADSLGRTAAHLAAATGALDSLQRLIAAGADPLQVDLLGRGLLQHACMPDSSRVEHAAQCTLIDWLLELGLPIEASDRQGRTALMYAAAHPAEALVAQLLRRGAKVNVQDQNGDTALTLAIALGTDGGMNERYVKPTKLADDRAWPVIRLLLEAGADPGLHAPGSDPVIEAGRWRAPGVAQRLRLHDAVE